MVTGEVPLEKGHIHYEEIGKGIPVVLIHAGYVDSRMWNNQVDTFAVSYRVIRYDVRGYGESSRPTEEYTDSEDLKSLLDHLGIQSAVLVGVSNGGRIAFDFAVTYPERVIALVSINSGIKGYQASGPEEEKSWENFSLDEKNYLKLRSEGKFREAAEIDVNFWSNATTGKNREFLLNIAEENMFTDETDPDRYQTSPEPPAFGRLKSLKIPTLIMISSADAPQMIEMNRRFHELIEDSKLAVIEGADHLPSITNPDEFRREVFTFLENI